MRSPRCDLLAVLALTVAAAALMAGGGCTRGRIEQFSATQVTLDSNGKETSRHGMYVVPGKVRMERDGPGQGGRMLFILRKDKSVQWVVNPGEKTYFARSIEPGEWERALRMEWTVTEDNLAKEKVSGFGCTKKNVEMVVGFMGRTTPTKATIWVSDRLAIPLRTRQENGQVVELRELKPGPQPPDLFDLPDGLRRVDNILEALNPGVFPRLNRIEPVPPRRPGGV